MATIYRTPDSNVNEFFNLLEDFIYFFMKTYNGESMVISVDFNIDINKKSPGNET